jgi:imidazolonepropionase
VAISTDFNPGSSYSENLPLMVALACAELGMAVEEALLGVTVHAAAAVDDDGIGRIAHGCRCDLLVLESDTEIDLAYHYGGNLSSSVVKDAKVVWESTGVNPRHQPGTKLLV